jgi:hypothetical protein
MKFRKAPRGHKDSPGAIVWASSGNLVSFFLPYLFPFRRWGKEEVILLGK